MAKHLINDPSLAVPEMLQGMALSTPGVGLLDALPDLKVAVRTDWARDRVALISGGGAGHEPFAAGYVGRAGLTAAVSGDVFASPSTKAVLSAILAVASDSPHGALVLILNYTGDRLHFGLAVEQAKALGIDTELVVVSDDIAIDSSALGVIGARGIAGMAFMVKLVGAAAESGMPLAHLKVFAEAVSANLYSMGVSLSPCVLPGKDPSLRLGPTEIELGLGIHGEPGVQRATLTPVDTLVPVVIDRIVSAGGLVPGDRVAMLVNNLGGTTALETSIVVRAAVATAEALHGLVVARVLSGMFVTSLDMSGFSLTLLRLTDEFLGALDAPTTASAWPRTARPDRPVAIPVHGHLLETVSFCRPACITNPQGLVFQRVLHAACHALIADEARLTDFDEKVGDGDCGQTLRRAAERILLDMQESYPLNSIPDSFHALSLTVESCMGGTSGALFSIFFRSVHASLVRAGDSEPLTLAKALLTAAKVLSEYGGAGLGNRTMLDALIPGCTALVEGLESGLSGPAALHRVKDLTLECAENTKTMHAGAGRSNYVPKELLESVPDPGACAIADIFQAAYTALSE